MLKYWLLGLVATALSYTATPWIARFAERIGAVSEADSRSVHHGRVPSLGGLAVLLALVLSLAVVAGLDEFVRSALANLSGSGSWLLAGLLVSVACGAADDKWSLGPAAKLSLQLLAGVLVILAGFGIGGITNPLTGNTIELGWLGVPLTLLWVVGITNAFNLIDGLDGLAAGVGSIASATLFVVALGSGQVEVAVVAIALAGALLGFLPYNFHPARVFLGDSGALLLGFLLAVLSIHALQKGATAVVIATPVLALGLPIVDTALAMARRSLGALAVVRRDAERRGYRFIRLRSASILRADRDHIHHRLLAMGMTQRRVVLLLYAVCFAFNLLAFMAVRARGPDLAFLIALPAVATWFAIRKLGYDEIALLERGTLLPLFDLPVFNRRALHAIVDAGFVAAAFGTAVTMIRTSVVGGLERQQLLTSLVLITSVKIAVFVYGGVYRRPYRPAGLADVVSLVRYLVAAEVASLIAVSVVVDLPQPAGALIALDFYFGATLLVGSRLSFRLLESFAGSEQASDPQARPVMILGTGESALAALREILGNAAVGYRAVGFLDDDRQLWGTTVHGYPVFGNLEQLPALFERGPACDVVLAGAPVADARLADLQEVCARHGTRVLRFRTLLEPLAPRGMLREPRRHQGT